MQSMPENDVSNHACAREQRCNHFIGPTISLYTSESSQEEANGKLTGQLWCVEATQCHLRTIDHVQMWGAKPNGQRVGQGFVTPVLHRRGKHFFFAPSDRETYHLYAHKNDVNIDGLNQTHSWWYVRLYTVSQYHSHKLDCCSLIDAASGSILQSFEFSFISVQYPLCR